jgi:c(7)-type cytochrome triheme protein
MKKFFVLALVVVVTFVMAAAAFASMKTVEFPVKGDEGKVTFDGPAHKAKGLNCKDCHPGIFKMQKGGDAITMKDINEGKFCGTCHNGTKAFSAKDAANCSKCHKK